MKLSKVLVLLAAAPFFWAGRAHTQERIEPKSNQMGILSQRAARPIDRELSHRSALGHQGEKMNSSSFDIRWFGTEDNDDYKWGEGTQNPEDAQQPKKQQKPFSPTWKRQTMIQDSIRAFDATINDKVQAQMIGEQLQSPLATMYITWQLTEPGVAAGAAGAMAQTNLLLLSRYASQEALLNQMNEDDRQLYFNCIKRKLKDGQSGSGEKQNWVAAMSLCIGDEYQSKGVMGGGNNGQNDPNTISIGGERFTLKDYDYLDDDQKGKTGAELKLTTLLFGPKGDKASSEARGDKFRADFVKYIGDIKFREVASGSGAADAKSRSVLIEQERQEPEVSPDQIYKDWVPFYYVKLMRVMEMRCESMENKGGGGGGGNADCKVTQDGAKTFGEGCRAMDPIQEDPKNSGGSGGDNMDLLVKHLSMPGFIFKSVSVDPIFVLFRRKSNDCKEQYNSDYYSLNNLMAYPEDVSEEHRATFFLARKIAIGKMLAAYLKAEEVIKRTNAGVVPGWVQETALGLLYDVAGTSELQVAYQNSIDELRTYLQTMQETIASRYPDLLAEVMGQSRNTAGSAGFLSPQQVGSSGKK